jgi:hypothetical protein
VAPIRVERGRLRVGTRRIPLLSGELQFWRLDPTHWEPAVSAIAAERIPIISTYLSWRRHAPTPDALFSWQQDERLDVRRFLTLCAAYDLLVQLKPGPWICAEEPNGGYPDWLLADRELLAVDAHDRALVGYNRPFQHPVPCYLHPRYLDHVRRWLRLVHEHIRDFLYPRGPVALIQLDNEPSYCFRDGMYEADYHPVVLAEYRRWLLERHGRLADADLEPPRHPDSTRREDDWVRFREWLLVEYLRRLRDMHIEAGATGLVFTVNYNMHLIDGVPQSPEAIRAGTGVLGGMDHYYEPPLDADDVLALARASALVRAAGEPLPWSPEIQAGIWRSPGETVSYPDPTPAEQELYYLAALAFGLKGLNFYMLVSRENWEGAPLGPDGTQRPNLAGVRRVVQLFERLPELAELEPITPIALAWDPTHARNAYAATNDPARRRPYELTVAAFATLTRAGYLPRLWNTTRPPPDDVPVIRQSETADALRAQGIAAPVSVEGQHAFAVLQQASRRRVLFVLNALPEPQQVKLHFADAEIRKLQPILDEDAPYNVERCLATVKLGPYGAAVLDVV